MKTNSRNKSLLRILCFLFVFFAFSTQAQTTEEEDDEKARDTIKGYNTGAIKLNDPKSVVEAYTYDPTIDRYVLTKTFEGFNINYPMFLTPKEYDALVLRESMRAYFQKKSNAAEGKGTEQDKKDLLPRYYVNSSFFETLFGSNTIDIKPTGSVEVDLGVRHTKQDNPSL